MQIVKVLPTQFGPTGGGVLAPQMQCWILFNYTRQSSASRHHFLCHDVAIGSDQFTNVLFGNIIILILIFDVGGSRMVPRDETRGGCH